MICYSLPEMKQGSVYQLNNFYGSKNKLMYRVADHIATVSFTWNSEMSVLHEVPISFDEDRFRFHSYEDFKANCDLKGDLYGSCIGFVHETSLECFSAYTGDSSLGSVYQLNNFYGSKNKLMYRVADHIATVSFTWNSEMSVLHEVPISFDEDRFRFHSYEDFKANCDLKGDLYDVVGHMKLVNGQTLIERPILDEVEIAASRRIMVHVQSHDGPVMKLYLWDHAATDFCKKFNSYENTPIVLLVTTVNTKRLRGTLALTSMSSTRLFMDYDVQPTKDYFTWYVSKSSTSTFHKLASNPEIANQVSAEVVTKHEALTIAEIFSYMTQESAKDAFFECTATIDDVVHGSAWYYIGCSECHAKATKGATSLICTNTRCGKVNTTGVAQYRAKISVYDNSLALTQRLLSRLVKEVVTKREALNVAEIFSYMTQESAKDAFFECTATIDDVVHGSAWYYIGCSECHAKATKGATSLICTNTRCGKVNTTGVAQYRAKISVYDNSEQAFLSYLVMLVANEHEGADHEVPVPEALISIIGQTHKFCVKKSRFKATLLQRPEETVKTGNEVCGTSNGRGDPADGESKRISADAETSTAKRPRC
ncbi:hypothetical protein DY000_02058108 [Brassica cretica]|uniref:Replication factor A C-terminal domain-containing protein n=1 Tax=Brassica cretica TaxID=69181 RepID=A0ABQ7A7B9_BRACR|nr:hypothetical protein DY000_02058108 [Brassica cretica]